MYKILLKKLLFITISLLFLPFPGWSQISNPDGDLQPPGNSMIWAQTLEGGHFNEFWNYHFYLDEGIKVHITFSAANFGSLKDPVTGVRVSVYNHEGELYQLSREYPLKYLVQDEGSYMFRLREDREIYFEGRLPDSHRVVINTSKDGVDYDIDLRLKDIQPGFIWGDGLFTIGREKVGMVTHIPYAKVSGTVTINNIRKNVKGTAYMDHSWQDQTTTHLMHSGYKFISHNSRDEWDHLYFMLPNDTRDDSTIGYRLVKSGGKVNVQGIERMEELSRQRAFGSTIPRIIEASLDDGTTVRISRTADQEKFTVLGELSWFARRAARTFLGGEVIDFRGEATLMVPGKRPRSGNYSYFIVD